MNVSRIVARAEDLSKLVIRPAIQVVAYVRASKIVTEKLAAVLRVIECVQEFSPKLCLESFTSIEALCQSKINIPGQTYNDPTALDTASLTSFVPMFFPRSRYTDRSVHVAAEGIQFSNGLHSQPIAARCIFQIQLHAASMRTTGIEKPGS